MTCSKIWRRLHWLSARYFPCGSATSVDWVALQFDPTDQSRLYSESVSVKPNEIKTCKVACPKHQVDPHRLKPVYLALVVMRDPKRPRFSRRRRAAERTAQAQRGYD